MGMARVCGACKMLIPQRQCLEVSIRVIHTDRNRDQDAIEELDDEYCDRCIATGAALEDLVGALTKYKGVEASAGRRAKA